MSPRRPHPDDWYSTVRDRLDAEHLQIMHDIMETFRHQSKISGTVQAYHAVQWTLAGAGVFAFVALAFASQVLLGLIIFVALTGVFMLSASRDLALNPGAAARRAEEGRDHDIAAERQRYAMLVENAMEEYERRALEWDAMSGYLSPDEPDETRGAD